VQQARTALVLSGGGARAAYQVGVLSAVRDLLPDTRINPFPILCGTSAGAINAVSLGVYSEDFGDAVDNLLSIWRNFHAGQVYRADNLGIARTGGRWLLALMFGWAVDRYPKSLLDNTPLRELLTERLDFSRIQRAIDRGALYALSVTASGYTSGDSVAFFEGGEHIEPWKRMQRAASRTPLKVEHLLASSALPFIFPATKINREYFGDGSMRQLAPISPAVHLGAERIFIVGVGRMNEKDQRRRGDLYPSLAQVAGHALASIFLDQLMVDIEQLQRVNDILGRVPDHVIAGMGLPLRPIETLVISPFGTAGRYCCASCRRAAVRGAHPARRHRRNQACRWRAGQLPAVRETLHPGADRPRLSRHDGARRGCRGLSRPQACRRGAVNNCVTIAKPP
jgi:NTE family protein